VKYALLLWARNGIVGRVEIGDQDTSEPRQSALYETPFASVGVEVDYFTPRCENPHVGCLVVQFDSCFIGMDKVSLYHFCEDVLSGFPVVFGPARLEPTNDDFVYSETEQPIQGVGHRTLGWDTHSSMISKMANAARLLPNVLRSQNAFGHGVNAWHVGHQKT